MTDEWQAFQRWLPIFADVMDRRYHTPEWLAGAIWSGRARFWGNDRAGIVVEIRHYPTGAMDVHGLIAAGDAAEITGTLIPAAEAWGRGLGCIGAVIESRVGWAKALEPSGYRLFQTSIRKDL